MIVKKLELPRARAALIRLLRNSDFQGAVIGLALAGALAWEPLFWITLPIGVATLIFGGGE